MAMTIVLPPDETKARIDVPDRAGNILHSFTVVWHTPNDDEAIEVQQEMARIADLSKLNGREFKSGSEAWGYVLEGRNAIKALIRRWFKRADDPDYEPSDLDRMLAHDNYRLTLLRSLRDVTSGEVARKNELTPEQSGQQGASPAIAPQD